MILFMKKHFKGFGSSIRLFLLTMAVRSHQMMVHYFKLTIKKDKATPLNRPMTIVRGDSESQKKWRQRLVEQNIPFASDGDEEEIIFCEGPSLSWKEIINEIAGHPDGFIYLFHGSNTHAAVSSYSSRLRGEIFEV